MEGVSLKVSSTARWDDRRWLIGVVGFPSVPLSSFTDASFSWDLGWLACVTSESS